MSTAWMRTLHGTICPSTSARMDGMPGICARVLIVLVQQGRTDLQVKPMELKWYSHAGCSLIWACFPCLFSQWSGTWLRNGRVALYVVRRYGWVNLEMYESLRQGTEVYTEALEQVGNYKLLDSTYITTGAPLRSLLSFIHKQ